MEECAFCRIAAGDRDAYVLYETDSTVAFLDANPAARGHTLVAPKRHQERLFATDDAEPMAVLRTVRSVAEALVETLAADGISFFYTSGELTGTVRHAHVHLVPRTADDHIRLALTRDSLDDADAAQLAETLGARTAGTTD